MKLKIKRKYRNSSDANLLKTANRVSVGMKGNKDLPEPKPTQAELETACQEFSMAVSLAGRNDRTLSSAKNAKKAALIGMLDEFADYVTATSKGDSTVLLSSGFDIAGLKTDAQDQLGQVEKVTVVATMPGQATIRVKRVAGARMYIHQCTPDPVTPDSVWISETTSDRENTFTNLKSVARYWFRVIVLGKGKQMMYSVPISKVIE